MSVNVQPSYGSQPVAVAGMPADMSTWDADSKFVETAAGIGFARAVSQGTDPKGVILGGTAIGYRGVTYRDITLRVTNGDKYLQRDLAGVCIRGDIWVDVAAAVVVTNRVFFDTATGQLGTATGIEIAEARWMTAQATPGGLAIVRLNGLSATAVAP